MRERIFIFGAGRAGRGLARAFQGVGAHVVGLHGRTIDTAAGVTAGPVPATIQTASVVLVTVRDAQLEQALAELARAPLGDSVVVLHASGCADPAGLLTLRAMGHPCGTFHPLIPLPADADPSPLLATAFVGVDGDAVAVAAAHRLAGRLGARVLRIPAGAKPRYHAAAVIASNFPVVLGAVAESLLATAGVPATEAGAAVASLMSASVAYLGTSGAAAALTGPVARGDIATIETHVAALQATPDVLALYRILTRAAAALAYSATRGGPTLAAIERALAGP